MGLDGQLTNILESLTFEGRINNDFLGPNKKNLSGIGLALF